jgi:two-component system chemotaxis sensor kinase CheA
MGTVFSALVDAVGRLLFEPPSRTLDPTDRRRARLLAKLQLFHCLQMATDATLVERFGPRNVGNIHAMVPRVLGVGALLIACAYILGRTKGPRASLWTYVPITLGVPIAMLTLVQPMPAAFVQVAYLIPPLLLVSTVSTARAAATSAVVAIFATMFAAPRGLHWSEAEPYHALQFFALSTVLIVIFSVHRDHVEADRARELRSRNQELEALRRTLEARVVERTQELQVRNAGMRLVLDNVAQGLMIVDRSAFLASEHSAILDRWFDAPASGARFYDYLGRLSSEFGEEARAAWEQVVDDLLPVELALGQLPSVLHMGGRHYRLSYAQIGAGAAEQFLIVVSDVTDEVERGAMQREKHEAVAMFEHILADRSGFVSFIEEASALVEAVAESRDSTVVARALHTLKGNSLTMGLQSLGALCHDIEGRLAQWRPTLAVEDVRALRDSWTRLRAVCDRLLGNNKNIVEVTPEQHEELERAVRREAPHHELAALVHDLKLEPVERRFIYFAEQIQRLAHDLGKQVDVELHHEPIRLDGRVYGPFWAALIHGIRNVVDHGIEGADERRARGKPERGKITLRAARRDSRIVLELEDDGRGIDWEGVRRKCRDAGIPAETPEQLVEGLFADGVSTSSELTEISGRGIGMGALAAAVATLKGELSVRSTPDKGTMLRIGFPQDPRSHGTTANAFSVRTRTLIPA